MKISDIHRTSAATARLLGYKVSRIYYTDAQISLAVLCPLGRRVAVFNGYTNYSGSGRYKAVESMPDYEALSHVIVRLHMERHYKIDTPHYWER